MRAYAIRRLLLIIPTLLLTTVIIFLLLRLMPGDIVDAMIVELEEAYGSIEGYTEGQMRAEVEEELGLNVPIFTQYGRYLGVIPRDDGSFSGILQGNLGNSMWQRKPVVDLIMPRLPVTFQLSLMAVILAYLVAIPVGIYAAVRQDTWGDYLGRSFAIGWLSIPNFWLATMVMVFPALWWNWSPPIYIIKFFDDPIGNLGMFIIPALIMGMASSGGMMRSTRTWMLEVLRQDYVRTAWAKGLRERVVLIRHAFRNTLIPIVTRMGGLMPSLIGGTVIIENIFCLPGMGQLLIFSLARRDFIVVNALLLLSGILIMFGNLMADLLYGVVDPRIRYK